MKLVVNENVVSDLFIPYGMDGEVTLRLQEHLGEIVRVATSPIDAREGFKLSIYLKNGNVINGLVQLTTAGEPYVSQTIEPVELPPVVDVPSVEDTVSPEQVVDSIIDVVVNAQESLSTSADFSQSNNDASGSSTEAV